MQSIVLETKELLNYQIHIACYIPCKNVFLVRTSKGIIPFKDTTEAIDSKI